jgi:hypothetical protein
VIRDEINLINLDQIQAKCVNCFTKGQADVELEVHGVLSAITYNRLTMDGAMIGNMYYKMNFSSTSRANIRTSAETCVCPENFVIRPDIQCQDWFICWCMRASLTSIRLGVYNSASI